MKSLIFGEPHLYTLVKFYFILSLIESFKLTGLLDNFPDSEIASC